jgi:hypothetical protein
MQAGHKSTHVADWHILFARGPPDQSVDIHGALVVLGTHQGLQEVPACALTGVFRAEACVRSKQQTGASKRAGLELHGSHLQRTPTSIMAAQA